VTLGKSGGVDPGDHVADLKARVLNVHRHAVLRPGASEGQQVPARLEHPQALGPDINAGHVVVPCLAHEGQAVWGVGDDCVYAGVWECGENLQAIAVMKVKVHA